MRCVVLKMNNGVLDLSSSYRQLSTKTLPGATSLIGLVLFLTVCAFWGCIIYLAAGAL